MNEVWKDIPNYNYYQASNLGNVRMVTHQEYIASRNYYRTRKGKLLRQSSSGNGYLKVSIKDATRLVHRLVALAFLKNPNQYKQVNHINGNKEDNRVENLEWCSVSQNERHSYAKLGKVVWNRGKKFYNPKAYKIRKDNYLIRCDETLKLYETLKINQNILAEKLNISCRTICRRLRIARERRGNE